jgi:hypothetical protein
MCSIMANTWSKKAGTNCWRHHLAYHPKILLTPNQHALATNHQLASGIFFGLFGFVPLQFAKVGDIPLQFTYLEIYHYNFKFHWSILFSTSPSHLGPLLGVFVLCVFSYGRFCPCAQTKSSLWVPVSPSSHSVSLSRSLLSKPGDGSPNPSRRRASTRARTPALPGSVALLWAPTQMRDGWPHGYGGRRREVWNSHGSPSFID